MQGLLIPQDQLEEIESVTINGPFDVYERLGDWIKPLYIPKTNHALLMSENCDQKPLNIRAIKVLELMRMPGHQNEYIGGDVILLKSPWQLENHFPFDTVDADLELQVRDHLEPKWVAGSPTVYGFYLFDYHGDCDISLVEYVHDEDNKPVYRDMDGVRLPFNPRCHFRIPDLPSKDNVRARTRAIVAAVPSPPPVL